MHDPGDEHVDVPPKPLTGINALLAEWGDDGCEPVGEGYFIWSHYADCMRSCCDECAAAVDSEDGS